MAKNNRPQNQQEQKVVTKYDRKVQKRKEAQSTSCASGMISFSSITK